MVRRPAVPGVNSVITCTNSQPLVLSKIVLLSNEALLTKCTADDGLPDVAAADGFIASAVSAPKVPNDVTVVCAVKVNELTLSSACGIQAARSGQ